MRKRLAALHLSSPIIELPSASSPPSNKAGNGNPYLSASLSRTEGISLLVSYLDTYYLDLSSWLSLSTAYASLGQYPAALTCLDHAVVLSPHDPFVHLKAAETAYTAGEVQLAWKGFARVVEMSLEPSRDSVVLQGAARRAAYGAKLVSRWSGTSSSGLVPPPS
jgi:tetratricopeptide (TPR) repeat protein